MPRYKRANKVLPWQTPDTLTKSNFQLYYLGWQMDDTPGVHPFYTCSILHSFDFDFFYYIWFLCVPSFSAVSRYHFCFWQIILFLHYFMTWHDYKATDWKVLSFNYIHIFAKLILGSDESEYNWNILVTILLGSLYLWRNVWVDFLRRNLMNISWQKFNKHPIVMRHIQHISLRTALH